MKACSSLTQSLMANRQRGRPVELLGWFIINIIIIFLWFLYNIRKTTISSIGTLINHSALHYCNVVIDMGVYQYSTLLHDSIHYCCCMHVCMYALVCGCVHQNKVLQWVVARWVKKDEGDGHGFYFNAQFSCLDPLPWWDSTTAIAAGQHPLTLPPQLQAAAHSILRPGWQRWHRLVALAASSGQPASIW